LLKDQAKKQWLVLVNFYQSALGFRLGLSYLPRLESAWSCLVSLLNKVFQMEYSKLYMIIRSEEGESLDFYSFVELNKDEFNLAVRLIRQYIANISEPTDWQLLGKSTWETIAEPLVVKDERYDETASSINH